jgi:ABC-type antimicrobial peptide transport system permease subunit
VKIKIGFGGLLTVLFIGLKLTHYIDWSWLWVLAPLWAPLAFTAICFIGILTAAFVAKCL